MAGNLPLGAADIGAQIRLAEPLIVAGYSLANHREWVFNGYRGNDSAGRGYRGNDSAGRCGMHRRAVWACLIGIAFAATACGGAAQEPDGLADRWLQSFADGDFETYRGSLAADAVFAGPNGESFPLFGDYPRLSNLWGVEDFDGDGSVSYADRHQAAIALFEVTHPSWEWECTTVMQDQAECTVTAVDAFVEAGGGPPYEYVYRLTFEDGKIVVLGEAGPVDPVAAEQANEIQASGMRAYAGWVRDRYPDRYDTMFNGPCCSSLMIGLPDSTAQHVELMTEYFAATS
jgi:hypothetical protein